MESDKTNPWDLTAAAAAVAVAAAVAAVAVVVVVVVVVIFLSPLTEPVLNLFTGALGQPLGPTMPLPALAESLGPSRHSCPRER